MIMYQSMLSETSFSQSANYLKLKARTFILVHGINIPIRKTPAIGPASALANVPYICK